MSPVSYTHLDVYKRQENEELKKSYISLLVLTKEILEACIDTVSYTHLDVYKRQTGYTLFVRLWITLTYPDIL